MFIEASKENFNQIHIITQTHIEKNEHFLLIRVLDLEMDYSATVFVLH